MPNIALTYLSKNQYNTTYQIHNGSVIQM